MQLHETSLKEGNLTPFPCPICGEDLVVKKNNSTGEAFLGCSTYRETKCKGGYPMKREHITQILEHNNLPARVEVPVGSVKTPESSLPMDPPPPVSEFGGNSTVELIQGEAILGHSYPAEIKVTIQFDPVFQASLFAYLEKILNNGPIPR